VLRNRASGHQLPLFPGPLSARSSSQRVRKSEVAASRDLQPDVLEVPAPSAALRPEVAVPAGQSGCAAGLALP